MEETEKDRETDKKIMEENSDFLEAKLLEENQEAGPVGSGEENTGGVDARVKTNKARKIRKLCRMQPKRMHRQQTRVMAGRQRLLQPMP